MPRKDLEERLSQRRGYYAANRERLLAAHLKYRKENPEKLKACKDRYRVENRSKYLTAKATYRAAHTKKIQSYKALWRDANVEKIREYNKKWAAANPIRSTRRIRNPEKDRCRNILNRAVRLGKVVRPTSCSSCDATGRIEGHHHDYNKPFDVEWLCPPCHGIRHRVVSRRKLAPQGLGEDPDDTGPTPL